MNRIELSRSLEKTKGIMKRLSNVPIERINTLSFNERMVLFDRYMARKKQGIKDIGRDLGISQTAVRDLEKRAMKKLAWYARHGAHPNEKALQEAIYGARINKERLIREREEIDLKIGELDAEVARIKSEIRKIEAKMHLG